MDTKRRIEKFISDNFHSKVVQDLFQANEKRDRQKFSSCIKDIKRCIDILEYINNSEESIKRYYSRIKQKKEEIKTMRCELVRLRDGCVAKSEDDLFAEEGLEV